MSKKRPSFQFYPADFLADENVTLMSNQALGCYIRLLCYCWREGSIPSAIEDLAGLCSEEIDAMQLLWPRLEKCFVKQRGKHGRLAHPRLKVERKKQDEYSKLKSEAGKKGAKSRWDKEIRNPEENGTCHASANGGATNVPMAKNGSSSSTSASVSSSASTPSTSSSLDADAPSDSYSDADAVSEAPSSCDHSADEPSLATDIRDGGFDLEDGKQPSDFYNPAVGVRHEATVKRLWEWVNDACRMNCKASSTRRQTMKKTHKIRESRYEQVYPVTVHGCWNGVDNGGGGGVSSGTGRHRKGEQNRGPLSAYRNPD